MRKATPVPAVALEPATDASSSEAATAALPNLERDHVQKVYDAVATEWHGTRYKAWPRVVEFIEGLPPRSLVADLGCGNGKLVPACSGAGHVGIGCDFSIELVRIAALQMGLQAQAADVMALPYRSSVFDAAVSIAVLHHVSTAERRQLLVAETLRVLRPGGTALFYAWAADQSDGRSGHNFEAGADVFVPFHSRLKAPPKASAKSSPASAASVTSDAASAAAAASAPFTTAVALSDAPPPATAPDVAALEAYGGVFDEAKHAVVFQRYCHVYRLGMRGTGCCTGPRAWISRPGQSRLP